MILFVGVDDAGGAGFCSWQGLWLESDSGRKVKGEGRRWDREAVPLWNRANVVWSIGKG